MSKEPITVTLDPPITQYCKKCDYAEHYSFYSTLCYCPECKKNGDEKESLISVRSYPEKAIYVFSNYDSYDWANPSEKQYRYSFWRLPRDRYPEGRMNFIVDEELDTDNPLECATALKDILVKYMYTADKQKIIDLVDFLEEIEEEQDEIRHQDKIGRLKFELYKELC